jgi:SAM-dependent methyltransferase
MERATPLEMTEEQRASITLSLLKHAHERLVFGRRVRVLANELSAKIPEGSSVLDIGCGDGTIASAIMQHQPTLRIEGLEFAIRPSCQIPCTPFDGLHIPHASESFDVCMFVDVLHHTQNIPVLLAEASRVSQRYVLIKDHLSENQLDFRTLQVMDWVGNRPHGVVLPYAYKSRREWNSLFSEAGLNLCDLTDLMPIYPFPFTLIFGRKLHFIALLKKMSR